MVVKQVFDHSLREAGKRSISSLKAPNRYSEGYLASLETSVAMAALYSEEQGWPGVREITVSHIEDYLAYLQGRTRWFGERIYAEPKKLSKSHINVQYRRLHRFFNWLVEREHADSNPRQLIKPPSLDEKTVPVGHREPDEGSPDLGRSCPRHDSGAPLPADPQPGPAVHALGHARAAHRDLQAALRGHGPWGRHGQFSAPRLPS